MKVNWMKNGADVIRSESLGDIKQISAALITELCRN